jgi:hypothetical protein
MKKILIAAAIVCLALPQPADAGSYKGQVGKLKAVFEIDWDESDTGAPGDGGIHGFYYYPSRPNQTYLIEGEFGADRKLVLREYTDGTLTAVMILTGAGGKKVRWSGKMKNTDGREFDMWFAE